MKVPCAMGPSSVLAEGPDAKLSSFTCMLRSGNSKTNKTLSTAYGCSTIQ